MKKFLLDLAKKILVTLVLGTILAVLLALSIYFVFQYLGLELG